MDAQPHNRTLRLLPPSVISEVELDRSVGVLEKALVEAEDRARLPVGPQGRWTGGSSRLRG